MKHRFTLIVEEDFIPVAGFGKLPLPFDKEADDFGVAWLYTCGAQVFGVSEKGYITGHSAGMVAYIVEKKSALSLLEFAESVAKEPGLRVYCPWDADLGYWLRKRNMKTYLPFRNYGEHGGASNLEHAEYLSGYCKNSALWKLRAHETHRADVLYGRLAFLPYYAGGSRLKFCRTRLKARAYGIARLLLGRYIQPKIILYSRHPLRLIRLALARQGTFII